MKEALIIFTKNPIHGQVKTRLAATIGKDKALEIYKQMIQYTTRLTGKLEMKKFLFYSDSIEPSDSWSDKIYTKKLQYGIDLGDRMKNAFRHVFEKSYTRIVIIGTDCPELTPEIITGAFDKLKTNDVVIGPARDGGYYLLGMNNLSSLLFQNIAWSTKEVLQQTISACANARLSYVLLEELSDIDTEADLSAMKPLNDWIHD